MKCPSLHYSRGWYVTMTYHVVMTVWFLHCGVTVFPSYILFFGSMSQSSLHSRGGGLSSKPSGVSGGNVYVYYLEFFREKYLSFASHLFIYSIIHLYHYGAMDMHFILQGYNYLCCHSGCPSWEWGSLSAWSSVLQLVPSHLPFVFGEHFLTFCPYKLPLTFFLLCPTIDRFS